MYLPNTAPPKGRTTRSLTSVSRSRGLLGAIFALAIPVGLVATDGGRGTHIGTAAAAQTGPGREAPVVDSTSTLGPSVVSVTGRQLVLRRRNPDGTLSAAAPYVIRGVDWSPASRGTTTSVGDPNNVAVRRAEFSLWASTDIPLMKTMNVNTVYVNMDPGLDANGTAVLDQLYANGIMVLMTVDDGNNNLSRVQQAVTFYKDHPAILAWMLGNEWNINRYFTNPQISAMEAAQRTESAAALIKTLDSNHPVATSYGDIDIPAFGMQLADTQNYVNNVCHSVDIWGLNIFRGNTLGTLFEQWQVLTSKPMFLGEFGTDAFRSVAPGSVSGSVDGIGQAHWDLSEWNHLVKNLSAQDPAKVAVGGFVFAWNEEWWKVQPSGSQQPDGYIVMGGHPDDVASEDYFGIVDIDRNPRPLYSALKTAFEAAYQPPQTVTFRAASRGSTAEEFTFQHGVALFFKDGRIFYRANGGAGDGRGFNVAAIDPCTNALLQPVQHFDTWSTRSSGTGLNAMINFLDSLPTGTLILIAIADEAGLNQFPPNDCQHINNPYIEPFFQKLEALGSHQIRNYCYWNSWAMVTVKGEGQSRAEQLVSASEASATGEQTLSATLSPTAKSFSANGGVDSVNISTAGVCGWTASSNDSFVSVISPASGTGNGAVSYSVAPNANTIPRVGTLTIAGRTFIVSQSAPAPTPSAPIANAATNVTASGFSANWGSSSGATGYRLDVSTSNTFSSYVSGHQDLDVGNVLSRSVSGLSSGTGYYYRVRAYNGSGTSSNSGTISVSTSGTTVQVTVQTNPSVNSFTVDGVTYSSPQTLSWPSGSSHTIGTSSPQSVVTGTRYVWSNWSDGGGISHSISPTNNTTYTASFTTQHFLTMNTGIGGTVSPSSGWYNLGTGVGISATPHADFSFDSWTGSGSGSFTGSSNPTNVTINGPITQTANFSAAPKTVQFSSASYTVNEAEPRKEIVISRSGDTTSTASVTFATADNAGLQACNVRNGIASPRCDYIYSISAVTFSAGEASKSASVGIVDDSYAEGPESFTVRLTGVSGAALGTQSAATVTIIDNDSTDGLNPLASNDFFIRQHYGDFLGREPDPPGFAAWQNIMNQCGITVPQPCDRIEVSSAFFRSAEFQGRGYFIYRFYPTVAKIPVYGEFTPDFAKVSGFLTGQQLEAAKAAFVTEFMARTEFQTRYSSTFNNPTTYVDALLQTVGLPNHPSRQTWLDQLNANNTTQTRAQVLRGLVESTEMYQKFYNEAFVIMQYFGYLRRTADASYLGWIQTMNSNGGDYRVMINGFLNSAEYRQRFGP